MFVEVFVLPLYLTLIFVLGDSVSSSWGCVGVSISTNTRAVHVDRMDYSQVIYAD